jgi:dolichyl-diphosphooligosaccharide--protein glycosyltransferase
MPPLYDWMVGAVARAFGSSISVFEYVAAWISPVCGALTVVPIYAMGRIMGGHRVGIAAASIFAVLPAHVESSLLGDVDSHAAVAFLGALYLGLAMQLARPTSRRRRFPLLCAALVLVRAAVILSWSGSLLYLALGEATILLVGLLTARDDMFRGQAWGALATAALVAPWVAAAPVPIDGPFSTTTLSWFHVVSLAYIAIVAGALALLRTLKASGSLLGRLLLAGIIAASGAGGLLLLVPDLLESLAPGVSFLSKTDSWADVNVEQQPLFSMGEGFIRSAASRAHFEYGYLAYAIPLTALAALARARDPLLRGSAICLACWACLLGSLALFQLRFGSDFAPSASVGFALLLADLGRLLARRAPSWAARAVAVVAGLALLWPAIAGAHLPRVPGAVAFLRDSAREGSASRLSGASSLVRFFRMIRSATPETAGYFDPSAKPEYGILCWPPHGHVLNYAARRAAPANGFGPYLDREKLEAAIRFYSATSEAQALAIAERLDTRYVVTVDREIAHARLFTHRLHKTDGSALGPSNHVERFRLIVEGPPGGTSLPTAFPSGRVPRDTIPYKLYEVVAGAVLEAHGAPYSRVDAEVSVLTPSGRRFPYRATALTDAEGLTRMRVPYATETASPTRPEGPYRVRLGNVEVRVPVSDAEVRGGAVIPVERPEATP